MSNERRQRILTRLAPNIAAEHQSRRLCDVSAEITEMSGAGIMLMSGDTQQGSVCSSNQISALVEELQFALGEGPCVDAYRQNRVVLEPNLSQPVIPRWLAFATPALAAGVRAVFGFPLRVGAVRLGALNLYSDRTGGLSDEQHANALAMSAVAAESVLTMQSGAPAGQLARQLEGAGEFANVVHQASGMVAVQLGVSVRIALLRMRAHAFGNDESLANIARDVVARRLRFSDGGDNDGD